MHKRTRTVAEWLEAELTRTGTGVVEVAELGGIARQRVSEALHGEPVSRFTLGRIVAGLLAAERLRREYQPAPPFGLPPASDYELGPDDDDDFERVAVSSNGRHPQVVNAR